MKVVQIKQLRPAAKRPERATIGSAGYDLSACIEEPIILQPGECKLIPTGVAIYIENPNLAGIIIPRSKAGAKQGLVVGNLTGLIDSDYQGEWYVAAWNRNFKEPITISPGDTIAQAVFIPVELVLLKDVTEFSETTVRNDGGISKDADTK